ncbi:MAG: PBP1A family penicillin-binding protein [Syntrophomonadaceae bacterium]|nr:PBP1A family penicillin-binding protein [Syntrophomonadaceae bacterium]
MVTDKPNSKKSKNTKKVIIYVLLFLFFIFTGSALGAVIFTATKLPAWDPQQLSGAKTTLLYDDQEQVVARLHAEENRTEVKLDKVPQDLVNAFIATEDKDFYRHHGVNIKGIARAVIYNIQSRDLTGQGASTITQQLARNAFLSFDKRWERKLKEIIIAFKLESAYSKDEILSMYLNKINFGAGAYGVQAAANTYFGKDVSQLSLAESALLAGLPQSPNSYNPFQFYDRAKARQKMVLYNMLSCGYIDAAQAQAASEAELVFKKANNENTRYGYYIDSVIDEAIDILASKKISSDPNNAVYRGGLRIYTSMDADVQQYTEELYSNVKNFPQESKGGNVVQSAVVVIDQHSGEVKTVIGGRSYERKRGFNRATSAYRQPGSAIKPLTVYTPALENGYMPYYILNDSPISFKMGNTVWTPKNYDGKYRGPISMRTAVQWSINLYAIQMLDQVGIRKSFDFGRSLGLPLVDSPGTNDLSLAPLSLGGLTRGITPLQMAGAYASIANEGVYCKPHFITKIIDSQGIEIYSYKPKDKRVMSEETAWIMGDMLQTVCNSGSGTRARVPGVPTAGKTGTTEKNNDSWFCGYTPGFTAAVWMGYDSEHSMSGEFGGNHPARLFSKVLQRAHKDYKVSPSKKPAGVNKIAVCSLSGKRPSPQCPDEFIVSDYCSKSFVPKDTCDQLHEIIYICPESGKLAGKYCPNPQPLYPALPGSNDGNRPEVPTEKCDIHVHPPLIDMNSNNYNPSSGGEVYICTDPRNGGEIHRAIFPNPLQGGGCPDRYIQKIELPAGADITDCPLPDHQLKSKKPREVIEDILQPQ